MDIRLSDNAKRLICRALFLVLCALPTAITLRSILLPVTRGQWEARIGQSLGIPVRFAHASVRTPWETEFTDVEIGGGESATKLVADRVTVQNGLQERIVRIGTVSGSCEALHNTMLRIDRALDWSFQTDRPLRVEIGEITVVGDPHSTEPFRLLRFTALIERPADRFQFGFVPQWPQGEVEGTAWSIVRTVDPLQTSWQVQGGSTPLPGWLLGEFCEAAEIAGPASRWTGNAVLFSRQAGWSGQFNDVCIDQVDLEELFYQRFGQPVSGLARIAIQSAALDDGKLTEMSGELAARDGIAGARLLEACHQCTGMQIAPINSLSGVEYEQLQLGFRLRQHEVVLAGLAGKNGCVLTAIGGSALLSTNPDQPLPVTRILSLLAWPASPVNRHTAALTAHLVWPPVTRDPVFAGELERIADEEPAIGESIWR